MGLFKKTAAPSFKAEQTEFILDWDEDSCMKYWSSSKENLVEGMTIFSSFCSFIPEHTVRVGHKHTFKLISSARHFSASNVGLVRKTPGSREYDPIGEYDLHELNNQESIGSTETYLCYDCGTRRYQVSTLARRKDLLIVSYDQLMAEVGLADRGSLAMMALIDASYELEPDVSSGVYTISQDGSHISNPDGKTANINWDRSQ